MAERYLDLTRADHRTVVLSAHVESVPLLPIEEHEDANL